MNTEMSFREKIKTILSRHQDSTLISRWEESMPSETEVEPIAYWIRESEDLVNIVWLMSKEVRDITWYPEDQSSTFNLLRYSAVAGIEIREEENAAKERLNVNGNYLVRVFAYSEKGDLFWVASNIEETNELRGFIKSFLKVVLSY